MNKKQIIKLNENQLTKLVENSVKKILKENFNTDDFFNDLNNMVDNPQDYAEEYAPQYPDEIYEWGKKVQELGLELSRFCGQYRENKELYETLKSIESEYNAVCGDLNTYGIASHWES